MSRARAGLIDELARTVVAIARDRPTLVAIEGRSAAGKSTFARELGEAVRRLNRPVLACSIDDFHPPGHKQRSIARAYTPESFVEEGYAYDAFRQQMIDPLRVGDRRCKVATWDSARDRAAEVDWVEPAPDVVAIVEGSCLFHPKLSDAWDYAVWLDIDWDTMIARAARRDVAWVGSEDAVVRKYREFWIPMHAYYETTTGVVGRCDAVIDHRSFESPTWIERTSST